MTDLSKFETDDKTFVADLERSKGPVWKAALWLSNLGYSIIVKPTFVRDTVENMGDFSDEGDLEIVQRVEVKRRDLHFTSQDDYPYGTVIVDVAHTWDRAHPKPYAYLIFNDDMSVCCVVKRETSTKWIKTEKFDRGKNRKRTFYECPIDYCEFVDVKGVE